MEISRHILMGDPSSFSIRKGANPHTRNRWGFKKLVDRRRALRQWNRMVEVLSKEGVKIHVIPPHPNLPGLVFPANAGFTPHLETLLPLSQREFVLSRLGEARSDEQKVYAEFLRSLGLQIHRVTRQFEGEADFFPWGEHYLFTYGVIRRQHFVPHLGFPRWRRIYGFRSDLGVFPEFFPWVPREKIIPLELADERFYHGDTVFCSFGPHREYLLAYQEGLKPEGQKRLEGNPQVIWLSEEDAFRYAANSFQVIHRGECILFMPDGVSTALRGKIEKRGIRTVTVSVSEFFEKGGGSVKCLIGDLGPGDR